MSLDLMSIMVKEDRIRIVLSNPKKKKSKDKNLLNYFIYF